MRSSVGPFLAHIREELLSRTREIEHELNLCSSARVIGGQDDREKTGCLSGALGAIKSLRETVERVLNDSTETTNPLQMTKPEVISTVDFVLAPQGNTLSASDLFRTNLEN